MLVGFLQVAKHSTPSDGWVALNGKVYNVGPFINRHPGGPYVIRANLGKDVSTLFNSVGAHGYVNAIQTLDSGYLIGSLA